MAGDTVITVIGNLTADPELRFTQSGATVADFTVASTPRSFDRNTNEWKDGDALFLRCSVWNEVAENVAESLRKGMRVIVQGRLTQRSYDDQQGVRRTVYELRVDEVGPSLRYAKAQVTRISGGNAGGRSRQGQGGYSQGGPQGGDYGNANAQGGYGRGAQGGQYGYSAPAGGTPADPWRQDGGASASTAFDDEPPF